MKLRNRASLVAVFAAALGLACAGSPLPSALEANRTARWSAVSDDGQVAGELAPESGAIEVGAFQTWILDLRNRDGDPISGADVSIGGGMPQHGHGLPTEPRVTGEPVPGRYRIEGMKLNMYGDWIFEVLVQTPRFTGRLRFPVHVDF